MKQYIRVGLALALLGCASADQTSNPEDSHAMNEQREPKTGWQQNGVLITGKRDESVHLQQVFPRSEFYTVQIGVTPPASLAPPDTTVPGFGIYDAVADIEWSVEGATNRRTVSVGNGVSISGPAQSVKVNAYDQSSTLFGQHEYIVTIQCSKGTRPSQDQPPTLRGYPTVVSVLGGATSVLDIPPDAGVISVETSVGVLAAAALPIKALVLQVNGAGQILKQYDPTVQTGFVPVAPNATQVELINLSVGDTYRLQFTWGIEG
jgi:hypothetical protein